jgi:branched-chain amino acid transport system ATP-binding protein
MNVPAALRIAGLRKSFGGLVVTDDVSLDIAPGARHALIGPNGAGKTTLVGLLSGVLRPDAGRVLLEGRDVTTLSPGRRARLGLVRSFQVTSLFANLTLLENLLLAVNQRHHAAFALFGRLAARADLIAAAEAILERLRLAELRHQRVAELAYGQQRLVEIGIALALEPRVLLLDEPAAGIPGAEVPLLLEAIASLPDDLALVIIEHDMQVVRQVASLVTVLVQGRVLMTGTPAAVMTSPEVQAVYLGRTGARRFAAEGLHA